MSNRTCIIDGCERNHNAHGWCLAHNKKWQKYGDPLGEAGPREHKPCSVDNCTRIMYARSFCKLHYKRHMTHSDLNHGRERRLCAVDECTEFRHSNGYCVKHYTRWKRHGSATARMPGEVIDGKRICPGCQVDTDLSGYSPGSTWRCKACVAAKKRDAYIPAIPVDLPDMNCAQCGDPFKPHSARVSLCSDACAEARKQNLDSLWRKENRVRVNAAKRKWRRANADKAADNSRRYRARKLGASVESFARNDVFERDGWVCGICCDPIPKDHSYPSPLSASLDHVVPLIRGGDHSMANSQASHLRCNLSKGDRLLARQ